MTLELLKDFCEERSEEKKTLTFKKKASIIYM